MYGNTFVGVDDLTSHSTENMIKIFHFLPAVTLQLLTKWIGLDQGDVIGFELTLNLFFFFSMQAR